MAAPCRSPQGPPWRSRPSGSRGARPLRLGIRAEPVPHPSTGCGIRLTQITYQRDKDVLLSVRKELLGQAFAELPAIEQQALALYQHDPQQAIEFLNAYSNGFARAVVDRIWDVGDQIWSKYASGF